MDIAVTMNVYTHIGFDDAEEELKRMEEFRRAQAEVEQKKEKPMSQKMLNQNEIFLENEIQSFVSQLIGYKSKYNLYPHSIQCADSYYGIHSCKHWLDGTCDGHLCAESEIPELVMDDNYNIIDGCMLEIFLNIEGTSIKKIEIGNTGKVLPFSELASLVKTVRADTTKTQ